VKEPRTSTRSCTHCGLPVPSAPPGEEPVFCCTGCRTVHAVLHSQGLDDTYYRLREAGPTRRRFRRPGTSVPEALLDELDSDAFQDRFSHPVDGGLRSTGLYLDGVHCAACVWLVERLPEEVPGVHSARLDFPRSRLTVTWDPEEVRLSKVASWLARFGYPVQPRVDGEEAAESGVERSLLIRSGICWALAGNVMLLAFAMYSGLEADASGLLGGARRLSLLLAGGSVAVGGSVFFRKAIQSIRMALQRRSVRFLHMDLPISLGIAIGFGASAVSAIRGSGEIWFDSIAILIAALLTARWLQLRSRRLAGSTAERLLAMIPVYARKVGHDGALTRMKTDDLVAGDRIEVRPGEAVPADGVIVSGRSLFDTAVLRAR